VAISDHQPEWVAEEGLDDLGAEEPDPAEDDHLTVALAPPPRPGGGLAVAATATADGRTFATRRELKTYLRNENAEWAREIVRVSGLSHAQVNAELNRLSGVTKISEATVEQLEQRVTQAKSWMRRL
jgi:hypothetical protein